MTDLPPLQGPPRAFLLFGGKRWVGGNRLGTRWRGKIPIPPHAHPLVRRLIELANNEKASIQEIAERSGLQARTISNWRYCCQPSLANYEAALNALGYELKIVERRQ